MIIKLGLVDTQLRIELEIAHSRLETLECPPRLSELFHIVKEHAILVRTHQRMDGQELKAVSVLFDQRVQDDRGRWIDLLRRSLDRL